MWMKFRMASASSSSSSSRFSSQSSSSSEPTVYVPDPTLSDFDAKVVDLELMDKALAQIRNIMIQTHNGIEDFGFRTQESAITNIRSEEHTSELQSQAYLVCRLLLEKKKT